MNDLFPNHYEAIDGALRNILGNSPWKVKRHLSQGASAKIYQIECDEKYFIARISDPSRPSANIPMEFHCMAQASSSGVAPKLYYHDSEKNVSIMEYINAKPLPFFNRGNRHDVTRLADKIASLHNGKAFPESYSVFNMLSQISNAVKQYFPKDQYVEYALDKIPLLTSLLDVSEDRKPSHRDLHGFNVINDGDQYLFIDWENAGNESLYFDLAVVTNTLLFNIPDSGSLLLNSYLKSKPNQEQLAKFELMRVFAYLFYGFVLLYLGTSVQEPRLTENEVTGLKSFSTFIEEQVKENKPNMEGRYLRFGYASFIQGIREFKTDFIQRNIKTLRKTD